MLILLQILLLNIDNTDAEKMRVFDKILNSQKWGIIKVST